MKRRFFTLAAAPLLLAAAAPGLAQAPEEFPARPITLVAPFPAGSVTDAVTRVLAASLARSLGKPVVVENKAGAQGTIGAAYVANARPDGYTLLMGSSAMFVARQLYKTLSYDPIESFTPVGAVGSTAMMFVVPASSPLRSITDLARSAGAAGSPVNIAYGSPSGQIAVALFSTVTNSKPVAVSYRGIPQAMTDLLGGQVHVAAVDIGSGLAQVNAGKARALAISAARRYAGAPEIPTLQEAFPRATGTLETIIVVQAPAGTPRPVIEKLDSALRQALGSTEVKAHFQALNTSVLSLPSGATDARIRKDAPHWISLMQKAGIQPQ